MYQPSLSTLPDEILRAITGLLDIDALIALRSTSKRFCIIVDEPSIWRDLCSREFQFWDDKKKFKASLSDPSSHDWKNIVAGRVKNFKLVRKSVQELIEDPVGRSDRVQAIVDGGYNSKDALLDSFNVALGSTNYLAQRYWSWVALGCLHRTTAVREWDKIKFRTDDEDITERALAALDMFVLDQKDIGDMDDIFDTLQSYVQSVREAHPEIDNQTPRQKATTIAAYLRERKWIGLDSDSQYYSLDNMFLGVALYSSHHSSSPLLSSVIYCYVCRQFGLRAQPCSFPVHVHSVVQPPHGTDLDGNPLSISTSDKTDNDDNDADPSSKSHPRLYMDPYNQTEPVPFLRLQQQLRLLGSRFTQEDLRFVLEPASYRDLLVRSANNIINSIVEHTPSHTYAIDIESAIYAARFALATFPTNPEHVRTNLKNLTQTFLHNFDHDIHIFRSHIMPMTHGLPDHLAYRNLSAQLLQCELERPTPKHRPDTPMNISTPTSTTQITYKIGQVFRHKRAGYLAVIYGWDPICEMSPQWIAFNNVDGLPRGRWQPFYNAFVADDSSTRYVAQENVVLLGPPASPSPDNNNDNGSATTTSSSSQTTTRESITQADLDMFGIQVGKWFRRFDYEKGVFVSNVREEYPDD